MGVSKTLDARVAADIGASSEEEHEPDELHFGDFYLEVQDRLEKPISDASHWERWWSQPVS